LSLGFGLGGRRALLSTVLVSLRWPHSMIGIEVYLVGLGVRVRVRAGVRVGVGGRVGVGVRVRAGVRSRWGWGWG